MAPTPPRLGFLLLLACCFSSSETRLLDWIWGSKKTTVSPAAPVEGSVAPETLTAAAAPTPSTSPGTWDDQGAGDMATPQRLEPHPGTAVPVGQGTVAKNTEQWDGNATGLVESTARPSIAPPHSTSPAAGQDVASSSTEDPRLLGTGTTEEPQLLGKGTTKEPQLLETGTTEDPQLLGTGTTEEPQLLGTGTTEEPQLLGKGTTNDPQLVGTGTTEQPQLLGTGPPAATGTGVSLQRPAGPRPGSAPFLFSPGDSTREQAVPSRDPTAHTPRHHHGASPAPPNLRHGTGRRGLALAGVNRSQSPPLPNRRVANGADPPLANNTGPVEFDLLTATMQLYGSSGTGLAYFLPGLMPPAGRCLPVPTRLPFCSVLGTDHFRLPNYLRHGSEVEIRVALHEWEGLLESRCHRYVEWFLCLLLLPGCSASVPVTPPPCQGFCEAVRDQCWMHLASGRLPLPCDALPEEDEGYSCVFINASAGNVAG